MIAVDRVTWLSINFITYKLAEYLRHRQSVTMTMYKNVSIGICLNRSKCEMVWDTNMAAKHKGHAAILNSNKE